MAQDKAVVAAVRTTPETVIEDYARVMELAGFRDVIDPTKQTILKNNISWHLLYPSANTTPWWCNYKAMDSCCGTLSTARVSRASRSR